MVFHWSLRDSKSPQVSRTLLSILAVFNNAVVWVVSTRPLTFKSSSPFRNPLATVPNAPITIGIIVTFMFHRFFFQFPSKVDVLILLFTFFQFYSISIIIIRVFHITLPTQSCLVLYSFSANLLHSLIMWLIVLSLSPHCLHLLFF